MINLHLQHDQPVVLVDGNNFALVRFHAGRSVRDIMNEIERAKGTPVFVFDGTNANELRRTYFPGYKVHPPEVMKTKESLFPSLNLFRELVPLSKAVVVRVPRYEADDVIATIARSRTVSTMIVSTDRDLSQLAEHPHVQVSALMEGIKPQDVRLYKTLCGDSSDRIPGIPNFGPKSWEQVFPSPLREAMETGSPITCLHGLKPKALEWCDINRPLLDAYYKVIGLFDVPVEQLAKHTKAGLSRHAEINAILTRYML